MSNIHPIRVLVTWTIKPGQTDVFMGLAKSLAEEMNAKEPGCRAMECFLGGDGKTSVLYEEYKDSAAVGAHFASPVVGAFMPKFMACADATRVEVLGDTSPEVTAAYEKFHAMIARPKLGFVR